MSSFEKIKILSKWTVDVAQSLEWSLPSSEISSLNPDMFVSVNGIEKDEYKEKRGWEIPNKTSTS